MASAPRGYWQADEIRIADRLLTFDGEGAPLLTALARLINVFLRDPFLTLVVMSIAASIAAALLLGAAASRLLGSEVAAAAAVLVALLSPAMLAYGAAPSGESVAVAAVAASIYFLVERKPELFAVAAAATIGVQPQLAPAVVVLFAIGWWSMPRRARSAALFAVCLLPVAAPIEFAGAAFRAHFIAHPWGHKFLSLPILLAAAIGLIRMRVPPALIAFALAHAFVCVVFAPALKWMIPAMLVIALLAAAAFRPAVAAPLAGVFAAASLIYVWPLIAERRGEAPPFTALRSVEAATLVVAAPDLVSFADDADVVTPERLEEFSDHDDVRLLVHGRSPAAGASTFEVPVTDACRKLTGERFHVVSLVPQPRARRFAAKRGVYAIESSPDRGEWRWLGKEALIELPKLASVALRFRLPEDAPVDRNRLQVGGASIEVMRGGVAELTIPASRSLRIEAEQTFTPPDGRELSVQLLSLEQR